MAFGIGDSVKVKEGTAGPDDDSVCIDGWQGRVSDIDDDVLGIRWDSITLGQMPREYVKKSEEEGLDWAEMYLSVDQIEPASPRDTEKMYGRTVDTCNVERDLVSYGQKIWRCYCI